MPELVCETCRFWNPLAPDLGEDQGECRRHAPRPTTTTEPFLFAWPLTYAEDFCGEWAPLPLVQSPLPPPVPPG